MIDTPFRARWKDYLGNAALHGQAAVVFAQLIVAGVKPRRPRALRPDPRRRRLPPGVGGEDDGLKGGLNGIGQRPPALLGVRVPRTNLLNRYGDVDANGVYTSSIASPGVASSR